jgi:predicted RNA-binding protein YlxR (DUF448 family)
MHVTHEIAPKRRPERTCVGCRKATAPDDLVRFVLGPEGDVVPDLAGGAFGRGAWVHPRPECLASAPRGMARSFSAKVTTKSDELLVLLRAAAQRRAESLLAAGRAGKRVVLGKAAVEEALGVGHVALLIVAKDARSAVDSREVQKVIAAGKAVVWGTKSSLGALCDRDELGVIAVLDGGLARALERAIGWIHTPERGSGRGSSVKVTEEE